ncbi:MAG: PAS domain S-box protein, partial [Anaerolineae bacterium]|nr:PAS domain S-box protein [Anaerolineae bacterium]
MEIEFIKIMDTPNPPNKDDNLETWFEQMPFGLYRTGADGSILYLNQAAAELFGFETPEEAMRHTVFDLYHDDIDRKQLLDKVLQAEEDVSTQDVLMCRIDGKPIWVRNTMRIIRDDEGNLRYFQGGLQDITREKEKEQQLALHSLNLRTMNVAMSSIVEDLSHLDETLTNALAYLKNLIPYTTASIFLLEGNVITNVVGMGFPSQRDFQEVCSRKDIQQALRNKRDMMLAEHRGWMIVDIQSYENWVDTPIDQQVRSHLAVALLHQDSVIGILNLDHQIPGFFTPDLAELAAVVAQQLSLMIVNARLYVQASQQVQEREEAQYSLMQNLLVSQTLYQVLNHLFEAKNVQVVLPQVLPIIALSLDVESIVSLIFEPATGELLYMTDSHQDMQLSWEVYQQAVGNQARPHQMADSDLYWPRGRTLQLDDGRHVLVTAVFHRGILAAVRSADAEPFHETEHELLVTIANQLTIAVENEQLYSQLRSKNVNLEHLINQSTEQLRLEQKRLQAILDATAEGIFYMEDFHIQYANPAFCKMLGYSVDELHGKPLSFIRPQDESITKTLNFSQLFNDSGDIEEAIRSETTLVHRSGAIIYASIRYSLIGVPGDKQVRMVAVARDISRERDLYYQQARFISNAAHELRNPLSSLGLRL